MTWWADLSKREQALIGVAAALFVVFFLSFFVVRPLTQWREDADNRAAAARDGYELVASADAIGAASSPGQTSTAPLRQAVLSSASAAGIELVRISNAIEGQVEVQSQPVDGDRLYAWLETLEKRHGATVIFADIARGEEGMVNAQVLVLERRG